MKILGIHYGHNATVGLLQDGKVVFCQSEERINRLKNSTGFPYKTIEYVQRTYGSDFDLVVFPQETAAGYLYLKNQEKPALRYQNYFRDVRPRTISFFIKYFLATYASRITEFFVRTKTNAYDRAVRSNERLHAEATAFFAQQTGVTTDKIRMIDHHQSHAYSLAFLLDPKKETLVFTLDGEGDELCATVSLWKDGACQELSRTHKFNSIGYYYLEMTGFLGMKPNEDEFKLMGLAPYAKQESKEVLRVKDQLRSMMHINSEGSFASSVAPGLLRYHFIQKFLYTRFDHLAAGMQQFLEETTLEWIEYWIKKTGVRNLGLSGGVFMNVKLNQRILELPEVTAVVPMPSAADESTVFGCMYAGWRELKGEKAPIIPITNLYLGENIDEATIESYMQANPNVQKKYTIHKEAAIDACIAELLAKGEVVARCSGGMEWGARGLGNRSILSDPRNRESVRVINEMIKNRDFWMPFAPSVREERFTDYFENPKKTFSPYMTFSFTATELGKKDLLAALHPYDLTGRPQVVRKSWNPSYYAVIEGFEKRTGVGAVMNTSFNLHGMPVVRTVSDAMEVMENSKLPYLVIGNYLISRSHGTK